MDKLQIYGGLPLDGEIRASGAKNATLPIIAGALRRYLADRGIATDRARVRTLVPVSVRTADEHLALGNRVSAMFASLPVDVTDPLARLHAIMHETRLLKAHGQPQAIGLAMAVAGTLPSAAGPLFAGLTARYPVVIVPNARFMPPEPAERLAALARAGGHVIFVSRVHEGAAGLEDREGRRDRVRRDRKSRSMKYSHR